MWSLSMSFLRRHRTSQRTAAEVVALVHESLAPPSLPSKRSATAKRAEATERRAMALIREFAQREQPGLVARAHFANCVKWGLRDLGHDAALADQWAQRIVLVLSAQPAPRPSLARS